MNKPTCISASTARVCVKLTSNGCKQPAAPLKMAVSRVGGKHLLNITFDEVLQDGTACFFPPTKLVTARRGRYVGRIKSGDCCAEVFFEIGGPCSAEVIDSTSKECQTCS